MIPYCGIPLANILTIPNIKSIPELLDASGNLIMDFEKILPHPETMQPDNPANEHYVLWYLTESCNIPLRHLSSKSAILLEKLFNGNWQVIQEKIARMDQILNHVPQYVRAHYYQNGKRLVENYETYGCMTLEEWREKNWDTSENAEKSHPAKQKDSIAFMTKNGIATKLVVALARKYPGIPMTLTYTASIKYLVMGQITITFLAEENRFDTHCISPKKKNLRAHLIYHKCAREFSKGVIYL